MATITTGVGIDLDDVSTYELIEEITDRMNKYRRKSLSERQIESLRADFAELAEKLNLTETILPIKTLDDKLKIEHLSNVWGKYSLSQIENLLS